jgi:predicted amino acid dehydrogenase
MQVSVDILRSIQKLNLQGKKFLKGTLAGAIYDRLPSEHQDVDKFDWAGLAEEMKQRLCVIHNDFDAHRSLKEADVVVTATNVVGDLVRSTNIKAGAVVCDISRPPNVNRAITLNRPDISLIDGGVVKLPGKSRLSFNLDIDAGFAYACMAETMILALERQFEDTSLGIDLDMDEVIEMAWLAERHGFRAASNHSDCKPLQSMSLAKAA